MQVCTGYASLIDARQDRLACNKSIGRVPAYRAARPHARTRRLKGRDCFPACPAHCGFDVPGASTAFDSGAGLPDSVLR
jgi:hypothetical protein